MGGSDEYRREEYRRRSRSPRRDYVRRERHEDRRDYRSDDRIESKLTKLEERRQEEARDSTIEWGRSSSTSETKKTEETSRVARLEEMKTAPFTRYADDPSLNTTLKREVRWDDPARGFVEELKPKEQKFRFQPNRFDIPPGTEWDGVDRSNGFEVKLFKQRAAVKLKQNLGHQYDVQNY